MGIMIPAIVMVTMGAGSHSPMGGAKRRTQGQPVKEWDKGGIAPPNERGFMRQITPHKPNLLTIK